jgi:1-acyl-sn-glycerol-3-phosphate acyltransferase
MNSPNSVNKRDWRTEVSWQIGQTPFISMWKYIGHVIFWPIFTVTWHGLENIPEQGACILASNHVGNFDAPIIWSFMWKRHPHFMAKIELFQNPVIRWLFTKSGGFPVKRGSGDTWAVDHASRVLEAGEMLTMFPEGTRSRDGILRPGKVGTVKLALKHNVPIIPAAIHNSLKIKPGRSRPPVHIYFGPPFNLTDEAVTMPDTYETHKQLTDELMQRIAALLPPNQRGIYG